MRHPRQIVIGVGLSAAAVGGVIGLVATTGSSSTATPMRAAQAAASSGQPATINVAQATVNGKSEQILVDSRGLPLYTYAPDTTTTSHVSGGLAALWPPLDSAQPSEAGATGKLSVVKTGNGQQVQYDGHFLYTFVSDSAGHVTGQGVQNFFVATPTLNAGSAGTAPSSATTQHGGYGY
jgi:predicted lipoprotein with Yx(FWY)xxD motif